MPAAGPLYSGGLVAGGAEHQAVYLARALAEAGFRVRHIVEAVPGQETSLSAGPVEVVTFERLPSSAFARYRAILREHVGR